MARIVCFADNAAVVEAVMQGLGESDHTIHMLSASRLTGELRHPERLAVRVPTWRLHDVQFVQDLYEELAKSFGLDRARGALVAGLVPGGPAAEAGNDTRKAVELARACKQLGAAGTLQVTPYYNKPTQDGLVAHFSAIAEASELPVVVYNVPGRTGVDLLPETVATLARHRRIVGIKEATGDMVRISRIRELLGPDHPFDLLSGDDFTLLPFLALGGHGVISVTSNVAPAWLANLCHAAAAGRWDEARALHYKQLPLAGIRSDAEMLLTDAALSA